MLFTALIVSLGYLWAGLFKTRLSEPRVGAKFEFRYQSLKSKISFILFVYSLMTGWPKKNKENNLGKFF